MQAGNVEETGDPKRTFRRHFLTLHRVYTTIFVQLAACSAQPRQARIAIGGTLGALLWNLVFPTPVPAPGPTGEPA